MEITVHHRHCAVDPQLKSAAEEKFGKVERYLDGVERAEVSFGEEHNPRIAERCTCEVAVHRHGRVVRATAAAEAPLAALDRVLDKVVYRLTRLNKRLVGRSHPRHQRAPHNLPAS